MPLKILSDIIAALNCKKVVVLILLDLSPAFDTIDHDICFHRLENRFGVSDLALQWFKSSYTQGVIKVSTVFKISNCILWRPTGLGTWANYVHIL